MGQVPYRGMFALLLCLPSLSPHVPTTCAPENILLFLPTAAASKTVATASLIPRIWNVATCHRLKVMPEINKEQIIPAAALW